MKAKKVKTLGYISKQMYYSQNKTITSPELKSYTIPLDKIESWDIEREVQLLEDGTVSLESVKDKSIRVRKMFLIEKEENKPIINEGLDWDEDKYNKKDKIFDEDEENVKSASKSSDSLH